MITFGEDRTKSILAQLNGEQSSTTYGNIESTINTSALSSKIGDGKAQGEKRSEKVLENNDVQNNNLEMNNYAVNEENDNNVDKKENTNQHNLNNQNQGHPGMEQSASKMKEYLFTGGLFFIVIISMFCVNKFKRRKI